VLFPWGLGLVAPRADLVHGARTGAQQLDDAVAVGLREGGERLEHVLYIRA
jgi:hypothetical protein